MFTGIIQKVVRIVGNQLDNEILTLVLEKPADWSLKHGQSIATNGVCLTVTTFDDETFNVELMPETLKRSTFGQKLPETVNVERAMSADGLFEGHIVQGHVDSRNDIVGIEESDQWRTLKISYPADKAGLLVDKGSVTLDGISLTIVEVTDDWFSVSLIPTTLENTTIAKKKVGDSVNVEYDVIAKLIQRQSKLVK
jgi:riboflavin synthase